MQENSNQFDIHLEESPLEIEFKYYLYGELSSLPLPLLDVAALIESIQSTSNYDLNDTFLIENIEDKHKFTHYFKKKYLNNSTAEVKYFSFPSYTLNNMTVYSVIQDDIHDIQYILGDNIHILKLFQESIPNARIGKLVGDMSKLKNFPNKTLTKFTAIAP